MPKIKFPDSTVLAAASIHALTASGVFWAFMAMLAAESKDFPAMFAWLGLALLVDGIDGPLARAVSIRTVLPNWNGEVLDLVVDYLTYVFIPAYAAYQAGLFPYGWGFPAVALILMSSAVFFSSTHQKTQDNFFIGFPAIWNIVLFYGLIFGVSPWFTMVVVTVLSVLTLTPIAFVHPLRVKRLRIISIGMLFAWSALAAAAIGQDLDPALPVQIGLAGIAIYFTALGVWRTLYGAAQAIDPRERKRRAQIKAKGEE
ncbi:MAG: phosphatidylcholine/phosphatidylserine synthase [Flavobacteriaceae bacterium]